VSSIFKYILQIIAFSAAVIAAGYIIIQITPSGLRFSDFLMLTVFFSVITMVSASVFLKGQGHEAARQTLHTVFSVSLKFLLELLLVLIWLIVLKKTGTPLVVLFFVLYLAFSSFLAFVMLKTLKNRSL
jgi:Na+/glutamate symporter